MCPRCGLDINRAEVEEIWHCRRCKGLLAGIGEVARELVAIAPELMPDGRVDDVRTIARRSAAPAVACPACAAPMRPVFLGGTELDRCDEDALLWFDRGELDLVLEVAREHHAPQRGLTWHDRLVAALVGNRWPS